MDSSLETLTSSSGEQGLPLGFFNLFGASVQHLWCQLSPSKLGIVPASPRHEALENVAAVELGKTWYKQLMTGKTGSSIDDLDRIPDDMFFQFFVSSCFICPIDF